MCSQILGVLKTSVSPKLWCPQSLNIPIPSIKSSGPQIFGAHLRCFRLTAAEGTRKKDLERLKASEDRGRALVRHWDPGDRDKDMATWWWWH